MHEQPAGDAADELQLLTIDEAAQRLRIGQSLAYELARTYLATGGPVAVCSAQSMGWK